jgi:hypothetical protein
VEAPSTPSSSAIETRSAGDFFFNSFKCMEFIQNMSGGYF